MGYSERSLRRVVDKIHDRSAITIENDVSIQNRLRTHIPSSVEMTADLECVVDEYDDLMFTQQDDNGVPPDLFEQETVEHFQFEPIGVRNEVQESVGQSTPLFDYTNENPTSDPDSFSLAQICAYQLISFLDEAKAPRNCYDRLVALLKKQHKLGFSSAPSKEAT